MIVLLAQNVPEGRVFGLDMQTIVSIGIQLFNGIILAVALSYILYKPVKEFMRKRTEKIQGKINDADSTMAKANELITEYDQKIKDINKERIEILEAARLEAADESKIILAEARKEAQAVKERSLESVSKERKRLQEESRLYIIELASLMAKEYISENIDDSAQEKIFEETLARLEDTQWQS
ncbi:ATP synthase F0 subunit B [Amphibacillus sp. MSJ-3]|uniref:ATP synthase F0 subunit B n=1 Tax=Amphibacillus sp. MSJ-3 TaxID=2841505 RepID=UPI0020A15B7E|nr:ATP synthase F0 subunit B [Amphibacillus sp. MSJ-3]